jgi:hypothetical protein
VRLAFPGAGVDAPTLPQESSSSTHRNVNQPLPPMWEIGDVVNVLEEWENIAR